MLVTCYSVASEQAPAPIPAIARSWRTPGLREMPVASAASWRNPLAHAWLEVASQLLCAPDDERPRRRDRAQSDRADAGLPAADRTRTEGSLGVNAVGLGRTAAGGRTHAGADRVVPGLSRHRPRRVAAGEKVGVEEGTDQRGALR